MANPDFPGKSAKRAGRYSDVIDGVYDRVGLDAVKVAVIEDGNFFFTDLQRLDAGAEYQALEKYEPGVKGYPSIKVG